MREYAQIHLRIWDDDDFRNLSVYAQRLYLLLLSHPTLSNAGVGDWRPARLAVLAGDSTKADIVWASRELQTSRFVYVDEETEEFLVRSFVRNDTVLRSRNMGTAVAKSIKMIASRNLKTLVIWELQRAKHEETIRKGLESKELQGYLNREIHPDEYKYAQLELNERLNGDSIQTSPIIQSPNQLSLYPSYNPQSYKKIPELYEEMTPYNKQLTTNNKQEGVTEVGNTTGAHTYATPQPQKSQTQTSPWAHAHAAPRQTITEQPPDPTPPSAHHGYTPDHNPSHWCNEDNPRCEQHAHIPPSQHVPPCRQCANVKAWFKQQKNQLKAQRRQQIDQCDQCDTNGLITAHRADGTPYAYRCDHQTSPKTRPEAPQELQNVQNDQSHQTQHPTPQNAAHDKNQPAKPHTTAHTTNQTPPKQQPTNKHTFENKTPHDNPKESPSFNPSRARTHLVVVSA